MLFGIFFINFRILYGILDRFGKVHSKFVAGRGGGRWCYWPRAAFASPLISPNAYTLSLGMYKIWNLWLLRGIAPSPQTNTKNCPKNCSKKNNHQMHLDGRGRSVSYSFSFVFFFLAILWQNEIWFRFGPLPRAIFSYYYCRCFGHCIFTCTFVCLAAHHIHKLIKRERVFYFCRPDWIMCCPNKGKIASFFFSIFFLYFWLSRKALFVLSMGKCLCVECVTEPCVCVRLLVAAHHHLDALERGEKRARVHITIMPLWGDDDDTLTPAHMRLSALVIVQWCDRWQINFSTEDNETRKKK